MKTVLGLTIMVGFGVMAGSALAGSGERARGDHDYKSRSTCILCGCHECQCSRVFSIESSSSASGSKSRPSTPQGSCSSSSYSSSLPMSTYSSSYSSSLPVSTYSSSYSSSLPVSTYSSSYSSSLPVSTYSSSYSSGLSGSYLSDLTLATGASYVTGNYGEQRTGGIHRGIDLGTNGEPSPLYSITSGTVVTYPDSQWNTIGVQDDYGLTHQYLHNSTLNTDLADGDTISAGTYLGESGNIGTGVTARSSGIHLHYQVRTGNGDLVDPELATAVTRSISGLEALDTLNDTGVLESTYGQGIGTLPDTSLLEDD